MLLAGLSLLSGCVRRTAPSAQGPAGTDAATSAVAFLDKTFAVAPFTIPATDADLLSGYLPANHTVPEMVPARLDAVLDQVLAGASHKFVPAATVAACAKTASRGNESGRLATLKYWQNVGMCAGADYVLVPMVVYWRERDGSAAGATKAASVNLSLYLVDTRTGGVIKHFRFEETQKALVDNLLEADKFVSRHGRWLTAPELSQEGLTKGVRELGL
jgi:hypothetical protein